MEIEYISFGLSCPPALSLRELNIRKQAYPFDWIVSSPKIIYDILINGKDKYLDFSKQSNEYNDIKEMFICCDNNLLKLPSYWKSSHVNYYNQHFSHYLDLTTNELKEKMNRYLDRFLKILTSKKKIIFIYTAEQAIFHKNTRDNLNIYYKYLCKISDYLTKEYPALDFKILNIQVNNTRSNYNKIYNYNLEYDGPICDNYEIKIGPNIYRKNLTLLLKKILLT